MEQLKYVAHSAIDMPTSRNWRISNFSTAFRFFSRLIADDLLHHVDCKFSGTVEPFPGNAEFGQHCMTHALRVVHTIHEGLRDIERRLEPRIGSPHLVPPSIDAELGHSDLHILLRAQHVDVSPRQTQFVSR